MKKCFWLMLAFAILITASDKAGSSNKSRSTATPYKTISVRGGGIIEGIVKWEGPRPTLSPFPINRDENICDPEKKRFKSSPRLIIGPRGGVANTIVYLSNIRRGKKPAATGLYNTRKLFIKQCEYQPHILLTPVGSYLAMHNLDRALHNIRMFGAATYNLPMPEPRTMFVKPLHQPGVISIRSDAGHGWMSAIIYVTPHPYFALSDREGRFSLTDVPPGIYTIKAWHENWRVARTIPKNRKPAFYEYEEPTILFQKVTVPTSKSNERVRINVVFKFKAGV